MSIFKFIWDFLRWLMTLSGLKISICICLIVMITQVYIANETGKKHEKTIIYLNSKIDDCGTMRDADRKHSDSVLSVTKQEYQAFLLRIIDKADVVEKEQRENHIRIEKINENLSKK